MFYEPKSKKLLFENSPGAREPSCFIVQTSGRAVHETRLFDLKSAQNARVVTILHPKPEPERRSRKRRSGSTESCNPKAQR